MITVDRSWSQLSAGIQNELITYLEGFTTGCRRQVFAQVLSNRTRHITVVLENIYQAHNASAVMRSCECFGVQDIQVIERGYAFEPSPDVVMGAEKWISLKRHGCEGGVVAPVLQQLKEAGYLLVATSLRPDSVPIEHIPIDRPLALCFGTEEAGLSDEVYQHVELCAKIPMCGFTQSFNVSVSVALCLYELMRRLHASDIDWHLSADEKRTLLLEWMIRSVRSGEQLVERFLKRQEKA